MNWKQNFPQQNRYFETDNGILYKGDSKKILEQFNNEIFDLVVTDPPYKVTSRGTSGNAGGMLAKDINKKGKVFKHNDILAQEWFPLIVDKLKLGTHFYIMTNHKNLYEYLNMIEQNKITFFIKNLIWDKGNKIMGQFYMSQYEYIIFGRKGSAKKINYCGTSDILSIPNKKTKIDGKNIHDTEKPVELMKILIKNSTNENDLILEPFGGSGSTLIAAEKLNRRWIGIEIDDTYCNIIKKRIEDELERKISPTESLF
jgi:site-specific DNA-methyltransferase (adenine-specific)